MGNGARSLISGTRAAVGKVVYGGGSIARETETRAAEEEAKKEGWVVRV